MHTTHRVVTPVAPVRRHPSDDSELVTQFLFGEPLTLVNRDRQWCHCQSRVDEYVGWVDEKQLIGVEDAHIWSETVTREPAVWYETVFGRRCLPAGCRLPSPLEPPKAIPLSADAIQQTMLAFLGAPYLWGGKTILGIDCSGLMQVCFAAANIGLPRDASQQVNVGRTIDFHQLAETGDLAFFGDDIDRITHVGFVIKDQLTNTLQVLHASGEVRIDALDHAGIFNEQRRRYTHTLRTIKRIIKSES